MKQRHTLARFHDRVTGGLIVPLAARVGAIVIAAGLAIDLFEHSLGHDVHDALIGAFPLGEHLAHLVVVIGMVLVLAGVIADGIRTQRRLVRQEGSASHAIR